MQNPQYAQLPQVGNFNIEQPAAPAGLDPQHTYLNALTLKIKFVLPITFFLLMLPLTVAMLLLCITRPGGDIDPAIGVLQTLSYISESNPIVDILPIRTNQTCDQKGYELASLGLWKGTYQGCYCQLTNKYERRECLTSELLNQCRNIAGQSEVETFIWNGDRFCVKRITDFIRTAGSCAYGYRKCGDILCVRLDEKCPISDLNVHSSGVAIPAGYTQRSLTLDKKLVFVNSDSSNRQFVQFSFSIFHPCLNYNAFMERINGRTHVLEKENHITGCGKFGDDVESEALYAISEKEFHESNNITTGSIPGYESVIANSMITLTARFRYNTIKMDQCAQYYISNVAELVGNVENFALLYRRIAIPGVILSFVTFVIALVYIRVLKRDGYARVNAEPFVKNLLLVVIIPHYLYAIVTMIFGTIALLKVNEQEAYLKELEGLNCFADQPLLTKAMDDMAIYLTARLDGFVFLNSIITFFALGTTFAMIGNQLFRRSRNFEPEPQPRSAEQSSAI